MKIIFMGTPEFAVPILEMLNAAHDIVLVITQPDKPVGRKKILTPSPVKQYAIKHNLPLFQPEKIRRDYQKVLDTKADLMITAAYGQMIPNVILDHITSLNVHGSLLPSYRGGAPIQYALFDGLKKTGITIMYMAYQMDSGDIISQKEVDILNQYDYGTLSQKLSIVGRDLLKEVLTDFLKYQSLSYPQNQEKVTFAYTLKRDDERISFSQTSDQIINRLRGLSPEPGGYFEFNQQTIKVFKAEKSDIISNELPGTVLENKKTLSIKTKDGVIDLIEIQVPGKKKMHIKDFLNGQSIFNLKDVIL